MFVLNVSLLAIERHYFEGKNREDTRHDKLSTTPP
jgi:hypothetical protein